MRTASDLEAATADAFEIDATTPTDVETATFGMGCFWSSEALFGARDGVVRTRVGYAGGEESDPTYEDVSDHTEVVQVDYDPNRTDYGEMLETFWAGHDPTEDQKQQYRSLILVHDDAQRTRAETHLAGIEDQTDVSLTTAVETFDTFHVAEDYHQKYYLRGEEELLAEFEAEYSPAEFINSTAAARYNAVVGGHGDEATLESVREPFGASSNQEPEPRPD
ncbi:peptide-methionine (S)-S-oxide reductase MsrA [Haloarculaceae archaeon H-GB2-1]|nr:peptide-methionine (S)-S-oxide reductase MsrA [Haloarculaceae archaeon H-GB1-1]MEA5385879.1 peptide-methionine (S)-S-oxide reductase MsrA [Haloarculaceae archaeon H-GB11]MEA5407385.1 peptide-methionine (S)-S-oxide reductase MsrA [Haloarculaceae archaeon H-GB2-1]